MSEPRASGPVTLNEKLLKEYFTERLAPPVKSAKLLHSSPCRHKDEEFRRVSAETFWIVREGRKAAAASSPAYVFVEVVAARGAVAAHAAGVGAVVVVVDWGSDGGVPRVAAREVAGVVLAFRGGDERRLRYEEEGLFRGAAGGGERAGVWMGLDWATFCLANISQLMHLKKGWRLTCPNRLVFHPSK